MKNRERKVSLGVVHNQICCFQCPHYYEGWDSIYLEWDTTCANETVEHYFERCMKTYNHNSHHSTLTIMDHIEAAIMEFATNFSLRKDFETNLVMTALIYHDIGKPQTKVFHNMKGEAHYYGHQNYSAYIYLMTHFDPIYSEERVYRRLLVANLIQFHMEHFFREEKNLEKFYKKTGLGKELEVIHKCDVEGH